MHLPSVKVVQKSMLIRPPSLPCTEARGSRQGSGRRLAGSLSTLLLHSGLQSVLAIAVTAALVLTARAEARGCSMEASANAAGFIKGGSFNLSTPLCLCSHPPVSLFHSHSWLKSCLFSPSWPVCSVPATYATV